MQSLLGACVSLDAYARMSIAQIRKGEQAVGVRPTVRSSRVRAVDKRTMVVGVRVRVLDFQGKG